MKIMFFYVKALADVTKLFTDFYVLSLYFTSCPQNIIFSQSTQSGFGSSPTSLVSYLSINPVESFHETDLSYNMFPLLDLSDYFLIYPSMYFL